jgi:hypothetical protein
MAQGRSRRVVGILSAALAAGLSAWPAAARAPDQVAGVAAVREELIRSGRVAIIAQLAGAEEGSWTPAEIEAARTALARELAAAGVPEVRSLGNLPFVALEVDARQLDRLLASGRIAAVALNRTVRSD